MPCTIDMMMDMLGNPEVRNIITEKYQESKEQIGIRNAITHARLVASIYFVMMMVIRKQSDDSSEMKTSKSKRTSVFN